MSQVLIHQDLAPLDVPKKVGGTHRESVVREAFKDLLEGRGMQHDLVFTSNTSSTAPSRTHASSTARCRTNCARPSATGKPRTPRTTSTRRSHSSSSALRNRRALAAAAHRQSRHQGPRLRPVAQVHPQDACPMKAASSSTTKRCSPASRPQPGPGAWATAARWTEKRPRAEGAGHADACQLGAEPWTL